MFRLAQPSMMRMVVGVGMKDIRGSAVAMAKAVRFAEKGSHITAVHVPSVIPEVMLSSMTEPGAISAEGQNLFTAEYWKKTSAAAGNTLMEEIEKVTHADELASLIKLKQLEIEFQVAHPSADAKTDLLTYCRDSKAEVLVVGPGQRGQGSLATFVATNAYGCSVLVVRDRARRRD